MAKIKKVTPNEERVNSFPSETLNDCRDIVSQIVKRKGETTIPFKEIAIILGKPLSNLILPISSCTQYGLLQNVHGSGYKVTDLFNKIEMPVFESDKIDGIIQALENPFLYKILIEKFNGKILPDEQGMNNLLTKEFGIKQYIIQKVVKTFYKNFKQYDFIDGNNRLRFLANSYQEPSKENSNVLNNSETAAVQTPATPKTTQPVKENLFQQAIDLGDDTAYLSYPRKLSYEQVELLRIHLEATLAALETRSKKNDEIKKEQTS